MKKGEQRLLNKDGRVVICIVVMEEYFEIRKGWLQYVMVNGEKIELYHSVYLKVGETVTFVEIYLSIYRDTSNDTPSGGDDTSGDRTKAKPDH